MLFAGILSLIGTGMMFFPVNSLVYYILLLYFLGRVQLPLSFLQLTLFGLKTKSSADTETFLECGSISGILNFCIRSYRCLETFIHKHIIGLQVLIVIAIAAIFFTVCGVIAERKQLFKISFKSCGTFSARCF